MTGPARSPSRSGRSDAGYRACRRSSSPAAGSTASRQVCEHCTGSPTYRPEPGDLAGFAKGSDPATALFDFLRGLGPQLQARRDLIEVLAAGGRTLHEAHPELARDLDMAIGTLLTRAQAAGAVRRDVTVEDVMNLVVGVFGASTQFGRGPETAGRLLAAVSS